MSAQITTRQASRKQKLKAKRAQLGRLLRALDEHRQRPPRVVTRSYINSLANRHLVHPKTMQRAFSVLLEIEEE